MKNDFKYDKFLETPGGFLLTRQDATLSGIPVLFFVDGAELSIMKNQGIFPDFDALSDKELTGLQILPGTPQIAFRWANGVGFVRQ
jgi:hypothetical protein